MKFRFIFILFTFAIALMTNRAIQSGQNNIKWAMKLEERAYNRICFSLLNFKWYNFGKRYIQSDTTFIVPCNRVFESLHWSVLLFSIKQQIETLRINLVAALTHGSFNEYIHKKISNTRTCHSNIELAWHLSSLPTFAVNATLLCHMHHIEVLNKCH